MTYMKLTAAKRIVFFYIFICNPVLEKRQFSNESQLKICLDITKVERGNKRPIHEEWAVKGDYATGRAIMLRVSMRTSAIVTSITSVTL